MSDIATQWYQCTWTAKTSGERTSLSEAGLRQLRGLPNGTSASHGWACSQDQVSTSFNLKIYIFLDPKKISSRLPVTMVPTCSHDIFPYVHPSSIMGRRRLRWLCWSRAVFEDQPTWPHRKTESVVGSRSSL